MPEEDLELDRIRQKRRRQILSHSAKSTPERSEDLQSMNRIAPQNPPGVIPLTSDSFDGFIARHSDFPVLIDYWAEWCEPCRVTSPIVEALERRYRGKMVFAKVDIDENQLLGMRFNIASIPLFQIFYKGNLLDQFMGALPGQKFDEKVRKILSDLKII